MKFEFKPISVNAAYTGKRHSTREKKIFMNQMARALRYVEIDCPPPYKMTWIFHISAASDLDNCLKIAQDCLFEHFKTTNKKINDKQVHKIEAEKVICKKGEERFFVEIDTFIW